MASHLPKSTASNVKWPGAYPTKISSNEAFISNHDQTTSSATSNSQVTLSQLYLLPVYYRELASYVPSLTIDPAPYRLLFKLPISAPIPACNAFGCPVYSNSLNFPPPIYPSAPPYPPPGYCMIIFPPLKPAPYSVQPTEVGCYSYDSNLNYTTPRLNYYTTRASPAYQMTTQVKATSFSCRGRPSLSINYPSGRREPNPIRNLPLDLQTISEHFSNFSISAEPYSRGNTSIRSRPTHPFYKERGGVGKYLYPR